LARVVEQAMDRDPARRFAAADELARALRTTVPAGEVRLPGPAAGPRPPADVEAATSLTRTYGPRPPRPEPTAPRRRLPARAVVGGGLVAASLVYLVRGPLASDSGAACPAADPPPAGEGAQVVEGDVAGDGCVVQGAYQPQLLDDGTTRMVLTIPLDGVTKQIVLGGPGDGLLLGDWNCDGADTPGLYRSSSGQVQYFDVWPTVEQRTYQPDSITEV